MALRFFAAALTALQLTALVLPTGREAGDLDLERLHAASHAAAPADKPCPFHVETEGGSRALPRWAQACPCGCGSEAPATLQEHGFDLVLPPGALASAAATRAPVTSDTGLALVEPTFGGIDHVPISLLG